MTVRVDARIDFYAKSVALLGLGLLGVLGAAVDYWPGDARLPSVHNIPATLVTPAVQTTIDLRGLEPAPAMAPVVRASLVRNAAAPADRSQPIKSASLQSLPEIDGDAPAATPSHWLAATASLPTLPPATWSEVVVELNTGNEAPAKTTHLPLMPPSTAADQTGEGFFSGMLKRTSSSVGTSLSTVGNSLGKASDSVVCAVRAVGDVFKKAF